MAAAANEIRHVSFVAKANAVAVPKKSAHVPVFHFEKTCEECFLNEVGGEEGKEGGRSKQQGEHQAREDAFREALQGKEAEDKREGREDEGCAAQKRAVERGRVGMAGRPLEGGGCVIKRGAMMVLRLVRVSAGLEEASRGEGLVGLVGMECAVENHQGRSCW